MKNNSGIILLFVLWLLVILSMMAIGLGRRTSIDLSLAKYSVAKLKADFIAQAGLTYALGQIKKDSKDPATAAFDTVYQCGMKLENGQTPEDILRHILVGEGYVDIRYNSKAKDAEGLSEPLYGLEDETARINLNALNQQNYLVLKHLIVLLGFEEATAQAIAASVVDWQDKDAEVTDAPRGAEDEDYMSSARPYHCKNLPFDSLEELLLVKGMTPPIFAAIKDYVTVYPKDSKNLTLNINTASETVMVVLGYSLVEIMKNATTADAENLAKKMIDYRSGQDRQIFTADDRVVALDNPDEMNFNEAEKTLFANLKGRVLLRPSSDYFRVTIRGVEEPSLVESSLEAVVSREGKDFTIVSWKRKQH